MNLNYCKMKVGDMSAVFSVRLATKENAPDFTGDVQVNKDAGRGMDN